MAIGGDTADDAVDNCRRGRRRRSKVSKDDDKEALLHYRHRKPSQPPARPIAAMTSTVTSDSQSLTSPSTPQQPMPRQPQNQYQPQPLSPPRASTDTGVSTNTDAEKSKNLLEWELSTLDTNDLRSHAWYHGERVGRAEAEQLLRKFVAEEHCIIRTTTTHKTNSVVAPEDGEDAGGDSDSDDGLEDVSSMSSDGDFAMDDYLDDLIDDNGRVPDPSTATSTMMAAALLMNQRQRLNGVLPVKRPKRQLRHRKHFYCFLVRASVNVKPPGRYVVSCLRVDKYDELDDKPKSGEDERTRNKRLRRQGKRRQRRQQRHPVLHFVINEIILQLGTVYERSQFTFADNLPLVASMATSSTMNNSVAANQPGFDSVPDLIRYYVGSASDDAVLSYGGGIEGTFGSSANFSQSANTQVRIRYPCNRRKPLTGEIPSESYILQAKERNRLVHQHSHALAMAAALAKTLPVPNACTIVPVEPKFPPHHTQNWTHTSSTFRPSHRRTPSATVTSATITSIPSSAAGSVTPDKQLGQSISDSLRVFQNHTATEFSPSLNRSSTTLPRPLPSSSSRPPLIPGSFSSSLGRSSITLPPSKASTSQNPPFTFGSSSNSDLFKMPVLPSTSSTPVTALNIVPNVSISELSSFSSSSSRFALSTNISNNKSYLLVEPSPWDPSTSAGFSTPGPSGSSELRKALTSNSSRGTRTIDMDAEIAAALEAENRIADDEFDFYHIPGPPVVRSSFARVDIPDFYQSRSRSHHRRSESCHSRSESSRSRSGNRSTSSMTGVESTECNQLQEFIEPWNDQNRKQRVHRLPLENTVGQYQQQGRQVDRSNIHKQGEDDIASRLLIGGRELEKQRQIESGMQQTRHIKVPHVNVKELTVQDLANSEIERMIHTGQIDSDKDSQLKEQLPIEDENFEEWRSRWTTSVVNRTSGTPEQRHLEHINRRRTRPIGQDIHHLQQGRAMQMNSAYNENFRENMTQSTGVIAPSTIQQKTTTSETQTTSSSIGASNDVIVETMISRWVGIDSQGSNPENNAHVTSDIRETNRNFHLDILQRRRRRRIDRRSVSSGDHPSPTGDNSPPAKGSPLPAEKHNLKQPQLNQRRTNQQIFDLHANASSDTRISQSSTILTSEGTSKDLSKTISNLELDKFSVGSGCIENQQVCDYENISSSNAEHPVWKYNSDDINQKITEQNNGSGNGNHKINNDVEYENIASRNVNDSKCIEDYENIGTDSKEYCNQKIRQKIIYDDSESSAAVAAALLAVHLAIIGDTEDGNGPVSVAGTGRLAAALCRADGRATMLSYRRHHKGSEKEGKSIGPMFDTCPLQVMGQPGPQGRRARLDIIERFSCLQYLVEMTVIVTPCLLLIGGDNKDPSDSADKQIEWRLEDEYEYRRRLFYYRCAGIDSWYLLGSNSNSDDEDNELASNSDFASRHSLPTKEEWAAEKRHWLDLLTRHRAVALDKWIRTAADAKQAVGDVYGYRALMTALCSDRIQALRDAWAMLRRIHTTTAVTFEARLRPEFLGRRDHQVMGLESEEHDINSDDMSALLQLPPNATVPDPTALAVLYEHLYDENSYNDNSNTSTANFNDINGKRSSSMFTSPLLLSPSLWLTSNNGISTIGGGLATSVAADYGLRALHELCMQYSNWVQQSHDNNDTAIPSSKSPMLQLERFRRNFQTLLRQYDDSSIHDDDEDDYDDCYDQWYRYEKNVFHHEESNHSRDDNFAYERNYEDKMEEFGSNGGDYDVCGDDDDEDDDATVICCSTSTESAAAKTTKGKRHCGWIKAAVAQGRGPAPLDIVFRTELHVRLFWPPTLLLDDSDDCYDQDLNEILKLAVPAYALGTTYAATAAATHYNARKLKPNCRHTDSPILLDHVINTQLDRAAQDMHLRYKILDGFLDKACSYSTSFSKITNSLVKN